MRCQSPIREVAVPLSDNEQRLLEQMERALYAEDPKFASAMRGANRKPGMIRRLVIGCAGIVVGLVVLVLGVAQKQVLLGVLGFVCMLAGTAYAVSSQRRSGPVGVVGATGTVRSTGSRRRNRRTGSFMQRLEQRWDRRQNDR
jgi:Flp pilus assembly protein TadB